MDQNCGEVVRNNVTLRSQTARSGSNVLRRLGISVAPVAHFGSFPSPVISFDTRRPATTHIDDSFSTRLDGCPATFSRHIPPPSTSQ